jgi:hypothetical protein
MAEPVQALEAKSQRDVRITRACRLLLKLRNARVAIDRCVNAVAAKKSFHRAMVTAGMAGLIASGERLVKIILQAKRFPANGMHHRVAVTPEFRIFRLELFNQLQYFFDRVALQRFAKKFIETLGRRTTVETALRRL